MDMLHIETQEMAPVRPNAIQEAPLVLTMGDPVGIGPEIIVKALLERPLLREQVLVVGDLPTLQRATRCVGASENDLCFSLVPDRFEGTSLPGHVVQLVQACEVPPSLSWGRIDPAAGRAAADCIRWAAKAALEGRARAVVTAPIHKEALAAAGVPYPGHTEFLQALAAADAGVGVADLPVRMMLSCPGLSTVLVSIHVALSEALRTLSTERVLKTIQITAAFFRRCGMPEARIAVAGINPHAGEGGLFGREELDVIAPAVAEAAGQGVRVSGPHAPDTVFMRARQGHFDVVIAMYHDQGLIPVKLLGLEHGVNTTLGLPFVRTSPDHGTAFDLAGTGHASSASLLAAVDMAFRLTA